MVQKTRGHFDDMEDDLPFGREDTPAPRHDVLRDDVPPEIADRIKENRRKNQNRQYKPQRNRHTLVFCGLCEFKFRASLTAIRMIRDWHCPACMKGKLEREE